MRIKRIVSEKCSCPVEVWLQDGVETKNLPVFLFCHGGGWRSGKARMCTQGFLMHILASRGWFVVSVEYRMTWPCHVEDSVSALHWVCGEEAVNMGADPSRVTICGASAGGHIMARVMQHVQNHPSDFTSLRVIAELFFYPAIDPGDLSGVMAYLPFSIRPLRYRSQESLLKWFFELCILKSPNLWPTANVLSNIKSGQVWPPTLVIHGERDSVVPLEHSRHFLSRIANPEQSNMRNCTR